MAYGTGGSSYGSFRYGSATPIQRAGEGRRQPTPESDVITPEEAYGSGWRLASNADIEHGRAEYPFDYVTGPDGDFVTVSGIPFLIQGIARRLTGNASALRGRTWNANTKADLEMSVERIATQDARVLDVQNATVRQAARADTIEVTMDVIAERAAHTAVFNLESAATPPE